MSATWAEAREAVAGLAAGLDAERLAVSDAVALLPVVTAIKNVAAAVEATLAGRVAESDRWRASGARSAAEDYARRTGAAVAAAREALAAAAAMRESERLRAAALAGLVSPEQARVIGDAADVAPAAVDGLLELVESHRGGVGGTGGSLTELKAAAERAKAAADPDPAATRRRIHARRDVWTRRDPDGAKVLSWRDNPERIDQAHAGLTELHNALFAQARREGRRERPGALDADALYLHLTGQTPTVPAPSPAPSLPPPRAAELDRHPGDTDEPGQGVLTPAAPRDRGARRGGVFRDAKILIRIDATALQRGRPLPGETCESAGTGPLPVAAVEDLARRGATLALVGTDHHGQVATVAHLPHARTAGLNLADTDALAHLLSRYGRDVASLVHTRRRPTAAQVTALQWTSPTCSVDGCHQRRTQIDHTTGWAITHHTTIHDLDPLCAHHHHLKTHSGWRLDPGTGKRPFRPPKEQPP